MLRVQRKREYQEQKLRDEIQVRDDKFKAQQKMLQKMSDDRKALKYQLEAEQLRGNGGVPRPTMSEIEKQAARPNTVRQSFLFDGQPRARRQICARRHQAGSARIFDGQDQRIRLAARP